MAEKILALSLMGIFYAAYLGKKLAQSRQGITTNQIGKGKVTDAETDTPVKGVEVLPEDANVRVYTTKNGEFTCEGMTFPDGKVTITFKDIDGY